MNLLLALMVVAATPQTTPVEAIEALPQIDAVPAGLPGLDRLPRPGPTVRYTARPGATPRQVHVAAWRGHRRLAEVAVVVPEGTERRLWVPRQVLPAGRPIEQGDLEPRTVRILGTASAYAIDPEQIVGHVPRRDLPAGKPIRAGAIQAPIVVNRGRPVTVVYRSGALTIQTKGQAMESGGVGEMVRVLNVDSSKVLYGVVCGVDEVEVRR